MKTSILNRNGITPEIAGLITRLVTLIGSSQNLMEQLKAKHSIS